MTLKEKILQELSSGVPKTFDSFDEADVFKELEELYRQGVVDKLMRLRSVSLGVVAQEFWVLRKDFDAAVERWEYGD